MTNPFFRQALQEWRREHSEKILALLDFKLLPERDQEEILAKAEKLRTEKNRE